MTHIVVKETSPTEPNHYVKSYLKKMKTNKKRKNTFLTETLNPKGEIHFFYILYLNLLSKLIQRNLLYFNCQIAALGVII